MRERRRTGSTRLADAPRAAGRARAAFLLEFAHPAFAIVGLGSGWLHDGARPGAGWIAFGCDSRRLLGLTWYTPTRARSERAAGSEPAPAFRPASCCTQPATVTFRVAALTASS